MANSQTTQTEAENPDPNTVKFSTAETTPATDEARKKHFERYIKPVFGRGARRSVWDNLTDLSKLPTK